LAIGNKRSTALNAPSSLPTPMSPIAGVKVPLSRAATTSSEASVLM